MSTEQHPPFASTGGTEHELAKRQREAITDAAVAIEGFFSVPQRHQAIARAAVSTYLASMRASANDDSPTIPPEEGHA